MTTATFTPTAIENKLADLQIEALVGEIRAISDQVEMLEDSIKCKKEKLRALLCERGESWSDDNGGYARLTRDSVRASYDREALDALTLRSPWWYARLNKYRKESPVRGGVQVR